MTSQVYYRKWRPGCFADLVGQEHVATTLRQAIRQGRVSHSYLFCGPRGTGKTTTARIVAKAVNCLDPQEGDPCNRCAICTSFNEERSWTPLKWTPPATGALRTFGRFGTR